MADPSPLSYHPIWKPRAIIESNQSVFNLSIKPAPFSSAVAAWAFAAVMVLLIPILGFGNLYDRGILRIVLLLGVGAAAVFMLKLLLRRRRVPTVISIGDGYLILITPDLPQLHHEFQIAAGLSVHAAFVGNNWASRPLGRLEVLEFTKVRLVFAHGRRISELREAADAVNETIRQEREKIAQSSLAAPQVDLHPL